MFAPQIAGQPVYVVQSRSVSTNKLYAWNPKASLDPIDLGFGSAVEDASLGREGLNGNPLLPTVHALGTDPNGVRDGFIQKGFPLGGSEDDRLADGLVLDSQHLAGGSIATSRDAKTGADQRPAAVFNNNDEIFYAVGRHPSDGVSPTLFRHWNTGAEWLPTRKLVDGGSALLAKVAAYSNGSSSVFFGRTVFADAEGRPAVGTFGVNGLLAEPIVLGEYSTGAFGDSGADIQHAIASGRDGRPYVVWVASNFFGPDSLLLAIGTNGGSGAFSPPVEIAQGEDIRNISMAVGLDRGAVAWSKNFIGSEASPVLYVPFTTGGKKAGAGAAQTASARPFASKPAVKANAAVGKAGFATVLARNGCMTRGRAYKVRVLVGGERGTKRPRVTRVAVTVAGHTRVDGRGPFTVKLSTKKLRRGRKAGVRVRLLKGRRTVKTLKYRLQTCR